MIIIITIINKSPGHKVKTSPWVGRKYNNKDKESVKYSIINNQRKYGPKSLKVNCFV